MSDVFPWRVWLALALRLGLSPQCFWTLSLREWRALIGPLAPERLDRAGFTALASLYPDDPHG